MKSSAQKKAPKTAAAGTRAKTLAPRDRVSARKSAAEREAEEKREKKRAASKRWYENKKNATTTTASTPQAATPIARASAPTLSKADLIGALKGALIVVSDEQQKLGLQFALKLAEKLS